MSVTSMHCLHTCPPLADPGLWAYTSPTFNNTYYLNTTPSTFAEAQRYCRTRGAQVASWPTRAEQYEVEQYFINNTYLQPHVHIAYWTGLKAGSAGLATSYTWADYGVPAPVGSGWVGRQGQGGCATAAQQTQHGDSCAAGRRTAPTSAHRDPDAV